MTLIVKSHADTVRYLEGLRHLTPTLATLCSPVASKDFGEFLEVERYCENVLDDGQQLCELAQWRIRLQTSLASISGSQKSIEEAVSVKRLIGATSFSCSTGVETPSQIRCNRQGTQRFGQYNDLDTCCDRLMMAGIRRER